MVNIDIIDDSSSPHSLLLIYKVALAGLHWSKSLLASVRSEQVMSHLGWAKQPSNTQPINSQQWVVYCAWIIQQGRFTSTTECLVLQPPKEWKKFHTSEKNNPHNQKLISLLEYATESLDQNTVVSLSAFFVFLFEICICWIVLQTSWMR